ncbi:MAG TPA: nickel-dependent lactate racemase [bacterium]|nr:nickel-dependent lactate racemase [bacterium]HOL34443.1 nickel-dependent lactate racemase [bacterium]HPP08268.1 nickel-dependent lactate racemase [bacterium]
MKITLRYGKKGLLLDFDGNITVLEGKHVPQVLNPQKELSQCLKKPVGCKPLAEIVRDKKPSSVCIVISDHTRAVPNKIILPVIIDELRASGVSEKSIFILIGNGTHRATTKQEKIELVGKEIFEKFPVYDHSATDQSLLFHLPGTDFYVNKRYIESDLKIVTGMIEPHFFAGFSGGRKGVCPGIAGMESIKIFHGAKFLEDANTKPGVLKNNLCHQFATEFAKKAGVDFLVNVTIDKEGAITEIFAGELESAFEKGVEFCKRVSTAYAEKKYPIVITTNGGYPLDRDFYQSVKGMVTALDVVEEGGIIISASECSDGVGNEGFRKLLSELVSPDQFIQKIMQPGYFHDIQWGVQPLVHVLKKVQIYLISSLSEQDAKLCKVTPFSNINQAIETALCKFGKLTEIAVIPDGPYTIVELTGAKNE